MDNLLFQYCPKLVVIDEPHQAVLLCRRRGEADYDGAFSLIGGKIEHSDESILAGIHRERTEEIGSDAQLEIAWPFCLNAEFTKVDGSRMILPHFYARYRGGPVLISSEYSESRWVPVATLDGVEPLIENVPTVVRELVGLIASGVHVDWRQI